MRTELRTGLTLGVSVLSAILVLSITHWLTRERIEQAQRAWLLQGLAAVLPPGPFDTDPLTSMHWITAPSLGSDEALPVYPVYRDQKPLAAALTVVARNGYNGDIRMLLGVDRAGVIVGARVIEHRETPGLGDDVEYQNSDWITRFDGLSLQDSTAGDWTVRQQGGRFDAFTGATITPRAVISAIYRALQWYELHIDDVYRS
jgi:electron transport complex protein RnfG